MSTNFSCLDIVFTFHEPNSNHRIRGVSYVDELRGLPISPSGRATLPSRSPVNVVTFRILQMIHHHNTIRKLGKELAEVVSRCLPQPQWLPNWAFWILAYLPASSCIHRWPTAGSSADSTIHDAAAHDFWGSPTICRFRRIPGIGG